MEDHLTKLITKIPNSKLCGPNSFITFKTIDIEMLYYTFLVFKHVVSVERH